MAAVVAVEQSERETQLGVLKCCHQASGRCLEQEPEQWPDDEQDQHRAKARGEEVSPLHPSHQLRPRLQDGLGPALRIGGIRVRLTRSSHEVE